jgi:serine/threonine protein kinase
MLLATGTKVGPYEIRSPIGAGGMGEVYRAVDSRLGRDVALKILPGTFARDPDRLHRFEMEARAVAALNHPNILAVFDVGQQDGSPFLVSELLEGESLRAVLDRGPLPQRKTIEYGVQIAQGMAAAHEKGIVHRDLKPENIFITKDGRIKILDFGLAKLVQASAGDADGATLASLGTLAGVVLGTPGYMAPEQVRGQPADARTDIFSFGVVLYEMLCGQRAFHCDTPAETMTAILKQDPAEISGATHAVSPALDRIVRRCLEKSPDQRFQSARDLSFALGALSGTDASGFARASDARRRISWWRWASGVRHSCSRRSQPHGHFNRWPHARVCIARRKVRRADAVCATRRRVGRQRDSRNGRRQLSVLVTRWRVGGVFRQQQTPADTSIGWVPTNLGSCELRTRRKLGLEKRNSLFA